MTTEVTAIKGKNMDLKMGFLTTDHIAFGQHPTLFFCKTHNQID